jgi:monovalent cation:H+ antiporter, CPA1 family
VKAAEEAQEILDRDRLTLGLVTLAGREREMILEGFRERTISNALIERMLSDAARLIEATRTGGRSAYRSTARKNIARAGGTASPICLHRHLRISRPLADRLVAGRFEVLLITRMILRDLHEFVDTKILRIHGRRVADLLHEVLNRREEELDREIAGLRLQYPGYAEQLERGFMRKARCGWKSARSRRALTTG